MVRPLLFEINTRYWLYQLRQKYDQSLTLADIPDRELESIADNFDWVWLMGVWTHSTINKDFLRDHPGLMDEVNAALDDPVDEDIIGSPYSIKSYTIHPMLGSQEDFLELKRRFNTLGVRVMLDFVPNHYGYQSDLVVTHPQYFVHRNEAPEDEHEHLFERVETQRGTKWVAYGKDPYFPPWDDTFQMNYWNPGARDYMIKQLQSVADIADGVRCDMSMLVLNDIVEQTWGWVLEDWEKPENEFWPDAISTIKNRYANFVFLAEVYWGMEWELIQQGFDFTYDKRLYDRIIDQTPNEIGKHLTADLDYQKHMCRFVENHDEPRIAAEMTEDKSLAAATMILTLPGLSLIHHGQMTGQRIKIPVQVVRKKHEIIMKSLAAKYTQILEFVRDIIPDDGTWEMYTVRDEDESSNSLLAWSWKNPDTYTCVIINYFDTSTSGHIELDFDHPVFSKKLLTVRDHFTKQTYEWETDTIKAEGCHIELDAFAFHLFEIM